MSEAKRHILETALKRILRPITRVLLRRGISFQGFAEIAKQIYVEEARQSFGITGRKISVSRIAVLTGLTRKEVKRITDLEGDAFDTISIERNRAAAVMTGWLRDPEFHGPDGEPAPLPVEGEGLSVALLIQRYSGDMPVRAVLDELVRVGAVMVKEGGMVHPNDRGYVPATGDREKIEILGTDAAEFLSTLEHNLDKTDQQTKLQKKVSYDNIPSEAEPKVRKIIYRHTQRLLEKIDGELSRHDRDVNPGVEGTGRERLSLGVYYFNEDVSQHKPLPKETSS